MPLTDKAIRALIFDFDGTLARQTLDFGHMRREAMAAMARHVPVPDRPDLPVMELLALVGESTPAARLGREAALDAVRRVEIEAASRSELLPFVRDMLARMRDHGLAFAVVTRNCPQAVETVFPDIRDFGPVLTRDDVPTVKPDPGHLAAALDLLGVESGRAVMIGDHPMDIAVGKACGTLTGAVATGDHDLPSLMEHDPDFAAPDAGELVRNLGI